MKNRSLSVFVLLFLSTCVLAQGQGVEDNPSIAGHSFRAMITAGFWISRHPSPDALIMGPEAIARFNASLKDRKLTKDIFTIIQDQRTQSLLDDLQKTLEDISSKHYYTADGVRDDADFMDNVRSNMNLSNVLVGVEPRYGLVVHFADQRFLPTDKGLYEQKNDLAFDQLQNSGLDVGTPVAVVHTSADGIWYYVMTDISDGWVESKYIAIGDSDQVKEYAQDKEFAVVIKPKADAFLDESMTRFDDHLRMGMRLPLSDIDGGRATVSIPVMDKDGNLQIKEAYMNAEDVNPGFLAFNARNIYKQALMMLGEPYGWGDMYGEQDCSRFLQMVFATMGINLPRDSRDQAQVSNSAVDFDERTGDDVKIAAIAKAPAGRTFLVLKGHIMLYLGSVDGNQYAIHDTTSYKQRVGKKVIAYDFDRVIISDLSLGQGGPKGSLLKRLIRTVSIE